jgi:hypothetical protein
VFVTHDVEEAIYLGHRIVLMAPRPGRIDTIYHVPLPPERTQDMKLAPEFLATQAPTAGPHPRDLRHEDRPGPIAAALARCRRRK